MATGTAPMYSRQQSSLRYGKKRKEKKRKRKKEKMGDKWVDHKLLNDVVSHAATI